MDPISLYKAQTIGTFIQDLPIHVNARFQPPPIVDWSLEEINFPVALLDDEYSFDVELQILPVTQKEVSDSIEGDAGGPTGLAAPSDDVISTDAEHRREFMADTTSLSDAGNPVANSVSSVAYPVWLFRSDPTQQTADKKEIMISRSEKPVEDVQKSHVPEVVNPSVIYTQPNVFVRECVSGHHQHHHHHHQSVNTPPSTQLAGNQPLYVPFSKPEESSILMPIPAEMLSRDPKTSATRDKHGKLWSRHFQLEDFEVESSPFDSVALKSLNDLEELRSVLYPEGLPNAANPNYSQSKNPLSQNGYVAPAHPPVGWPPDPTRASLEQRNLNGSMEAPVSWSHSSENHPQIRSYKSSPDLMKLCGSTLNGHSSVTHLNGYVNSPSR